MNDSEMNFLLERWDQTDPQIQRGIVAELAERASKWEGLHDKRTEQVKVLQAELQTRMAWRLTKACTQLTNQRDALLRHCEIVLAAYDAALRDGVTKIWNGEAVDAMRATVNSVRGGS